MASIQIYSSSPDIKMTGIRDESRRPPVITPEEQPQHCPLFWVTSGQGDTQPRLYSLDAARATLGDEFLDYKSKFATHVTPFINGIGSEGNAMMIQRLKPADAKTAWIRFSLGVTKLDDENGKAKYKLRWMTARQDPSKVDGLSGLSDTDKQIMKESLHFGQGLTVKNLGRIDEAPTTLAVGIGSSGINQERVYPIFDLEVSSFGSYGNNLGLRLSAPNAESRDRVNMKFYEDSNFVRPFRVEMVKRADRKTAPKTVPNNFAENSVDFVFKPNTVDPTFGNDLYLGTSLLDQYRDLSTEGGRIPKYGSFNDIRVYDENVRHILETLYAAELAFDNEIPDFIEHDQIRGGNKIKVSEPSINSASGDRLNRMADREDEAHEEMFWQIDFFTGRNINNLPYRSFTVDSLLSGNGTVSMDNTTEHWATGGDDGDVSLANFHKMVLEKLIEFKDGTTEYADMARYPFSVFYDTGYPDKIKRAIPFIISARKDTSAVISTHAVDEEKWNSLTGVELLEASQEATAVSVYSTHLRSFPESTIWGTGCIRANLMMQAGKIVGSPYKGYVPLSYELALKRARFIGAGSGVMRPGFGYDQDGVKQLEYMVHANNPFVPQVPRERNWTNGATWAQYYDRNTMFFPAVRTIYKEDSSVLLADINMLIVTDLQKVCFRTWRRLVGNSSLTNAEFVDRSNTMILQDVDGRYDSRVTIEPTTYFTPADEARGYSWSCDIAAYFNNMRTVGVFTTIVHRKSDLEG